MSAESYADLLEQLFAEFEPPLGLVVIEEVVQSCRHDLDGQLAPAAWLQMIELLARHRLAERVTVPG